MTVLDAMDERRILMQCECSAIFQHNAGRHVLKCPKCGGENTLLFARNATFVCVIRDWKD